MRTELLNGKLTLPVAYRAKIREAFGEHFLNLTERFFSALWHNYLLSKSSTSSTYWMERFNDVKVFNRILKALSDEQWIIVETLPNRNWSEVSLNGAKLLSYVSMEELQSVRAYHKFRRYMLTDELPTLDNLTRLNGHIRNTGLVRPGFYKAGHTQFQFDTASILEYFTTIVSEVNKGMDKVREFYPDMPRDTASYDEVSESIVNNIIYEQGTYRAGQHYADSRGREISGMLSKVFNPIGFKVARANLVIPATHAQPLTNDGLDAIFLFIAELNGFKKGTLNDKLTYGQGCYLEKLVPDLDLTTDHGRKDFYEVMWLTRIYNKLDEVFGIRIGIYRTRFLEGKTTVTKAMASLLTHINPIPWNIPIEVDMSASVLGYVGLLTNHKPFLERTNMLGNELVDAWEIKGIPKRNQAKAIMKTIYGSSRPCQDLWKDDNISYTVEDIRAYNDALTHGEIAVGDRFSKFIINNCNPTAEMTLNVDGEEFSIECNRFRNIGEKTTRYDIYDTESKLYRRIEHTTTRRVPDLQQFRRFFVTALIHNLDSQVEDHTLNVVYDAYGWALGIHDATIIHPNAAKLTRTTYAHKLEDIYARRNTILTQYFRSIGVPASAVRKWFTDVVPTVQPLTDTFICNPMVLK